MSHSQALLEARGLTKYFPVKSEGRRALLKAVDDVSFCVDRHETLGLVGESGCGKSTTGRLAINLLTPTAGTILLDGHDIFALHGRSERLAMRRKAQIIFQDPFASLNPRLKVYDIVAEPLHIHHLAKGPALDVRVRELLGLVGLAAHQANRFPHEFSGGQRQRIGIARALAVEPELIVCDEPVSALDVSVQSQVLNLFRDLQDELGLSYLFIAHGLNVIKHVSDRIGVMYLGQIMELATREGLFAGAWHPYTQALLSAIPLPDPTKIRERILLEGNVPSPINPPIGCVFQKRCRHATDACAAARPALHEVSPGHQVACIRVQNKELGKVELI